MFPSMKRLAIVNNISPIRSVVVGRVGQERGPSSFYSRSWWRSSIAGAVWETLAWRAIYRSALTCGQETFRAATPFC